MLLFHLLRIGGATGHPDQHVSPETEGAIIPAAAGAKLKRQSGPVRKLVSDQAARQRSVDHWRWIFFLAWRGFAVGNQ